MAKQPIKFGTDGWRAIIAEGFTFENIEIVTHAIGEYLLNAFSNEKPVVIGYDNRFMADRFAEFSARILSRCGFSVLLSDSPIATPLIAFAAREYNTCGALMFTASHNPPEYCGIKFIPHYAGPATPEITDQLVKNVETIQKAGLPQEACAVYGKIDRFNPYDRYVHYLSQQVQFDKIAKHPLKILYDPMYGVGAGCLDRIFAEKIGYRVDMIHGTRDPLFGGNLPEPKDEHLPDLMRRVPLEKYDLGLANDGDADRLGIVDDLGHFISANQIIPLVFYYLYKYRGFRGSVVRTLATSTLVDALAEKYGVTVHETPVGFKYVGDIMRRENVIIGGEESGGLSILGHIPEKDGILANLLLTEMVAVIGKPLSRIFEDLQTEAGIHLHNLSINLDLPEEKKRDLMHRIRSLRIGDPFAGRPIQSIDNRDGMKFVFAKHDWMLLRPSGTEPILRLYGESPEAQNIPRFTEAVETLMGNTGSQKEKVLH